LNIVLISTAVFLIVRLTGDPASILVPERGSADTVAIVRGRLGLDRPLIEQYLSFMADIAKFDLGVSFTGRPVTSILLEYLPATVSLALAAIVVSIGVAIPLGVVSAIRKGSMLDTIARTVALLGQSIPSFWLAIMLILVFGVVLQWFPVAHKGGPESYVLPAIAMGWAAVAGIVRLTRSSMLDVMGSDYVQMARAKGLPARTIYMKHAFRNAVIPVLTFSGLVFAAFLNGAVVVENVFAWPGLGTLTLSAVERRDFPVVQGMVIVTAVILTFINLCVDILYAFLDPRIRYH
jgi:peptide/nickel transport system permease protein